MTRAPQGKSTEDGTETNLSRLAGHRRKGRGGLGGEQEDLVARQRGGRHRGRGRDRRRREGGRGRGLRGAQDGASIDERQAMLVAMPVGGGGGGQARAAAAPSLEGGAVPPGRRA